jgi:hypothetical protein
MRLLNLSVITKTPPPPPREVAGRMGPRVYLGAVEKRKRSP